MGRKDERERQREGEREGGMEVERTGRRKEIIHAINWIREKNTKLQGLFQTPGTNYSFPFIIVPHPTPILLYM